MSQRRRKIPGRGFFAIGIENTKTPQNVGTLWRQASLYDAAFIFTIGARYQRQASDTPNTPMHKPLFHFDSIDDLHAHLPHSTPLIGVELTDDSVPLSRFTHPPRACYLLGAEDHGLTRRALDACHQTIRIETPEPWSMNVAVAGSLVIYDRFMSQRDAKAAVA